LQSPQIMRTSRRITGPPRKKPRLRRILIGLATLILLFVVALHTLWLHPFWEFPFQSSRHTRVPITPPWALECWVWEDDTNTADAVRELLEGYARHDIPVRTILIDSPWSTRYNDFAVDEQRYPDPAGFFGGLQTNGYRVVLWMTSMVNRRNKDTALRDSTDFHQFAFTNGYLAGNGHTVRWWKGEGSFLDYSNPDALQWWHGLQQQLFDWGIDGWKLDGTDTLFSGPGYFPYQKTHAGWMSTRQYMDLYPREEYRHGLTQNPEFVVLTRAIDDRYFPLSHPEGFAPFDAAPVTWVGDRTHEWSSMDPGGSDDPDAMRSSRSRRDRGFEGALRDILASAALGYCVVGDDIGGYHGLEPIPPRLYIRWAQFAAFTGLFLNGGHGERRLWLRSPEELSIIRTYSWLHTELVPYMYTHVVRCHHGGPPLMRPMPGPYHYLFGDDLFIAPVHRDDPRHTVHLPAGQWRHLWNDAEVLTGPLTLHRAFTLEDYPCYVRDGAILPLNVSRAYTGFGDVHSTGLLTWAVWPHGDHRFTTHLTDGSGDATLSVTAEDQTLIVQLDGVPHPHLLRIHRTESPVEVTFNGRALVEGRDWQHDNTTRKLRITQTNAVAGRYRIR
jgi:alpha-glucosidase (family GH31 glycosyl hydrolase)